LQIKIKFLATFHDIGVEKMDLEVPNNTDIGRLLEILKNRFGEKFSKHVKILEYLMIFINDVNYRQLQGLKTKLNDGDVVTIGHILAGGSFLLSLRSSAM